MSAVQSTLDHRQSQGLGLVESSKPGNGRKPPLIMSIKKDPNEGSYRGPNVPSIPKEIINFGDIFDMEKLDKLEASLKEEKKEGGITTTENSQIPSADEKKTK